MLIAKSDGSLVNSEIVTSADAIVLPEKWDGNFDGIIDAIRKRYSDGGNSYLVVVAEGVTDAPELAGMIR